MSRCANVGGRRGLICSDPNTKLGDAVTCRLSSRNATSETASERFLAQPLLARELGSRGLIPGLVKSSW